MVLLPSAQNRQSSVQSVGTFQANIQNNLFLLTGAPVIVPIRGIKLETTFIQTKQLINTSKRITLIDGATAALINAVTAGEITFKAVRVGQTLQSGDLPTIAQYLQKAGDTTGSQITVIYSFASGGGNSYSETWTFYSCTLQTVPPLGLAGNDIFEYDVVFSYDDYSRNSNSGN